MNVQTFCPVGYSSNENIATDIVNVTFILVVSIGLLCSFQESVYGIPTFFSLFFSFSNLTLSFSLFISVFLALSRSLTIFLAPSLFYTFSISFQVVDSRMHFNMNRSECTWEGNLIPMSNCVQYVMVFLSVLPLLSFDCQAITFRIMFCVRNLWVNCSLVPFRTIIATTVTKATFGELHEIKAKKEWKYMFYTLMRYAVFACVRCHKSDFQIGHSL